MKIRSYTVVPMALVALVGLAACGSGDKSSSTTVATTAAAVTSAPATTGATINIKVGDTTAPEAMFLKADLSTVPAGKVTFVVTNTGTKDHEVVVLKTDTPFDQLTIDPATNRVSEDTSVGETGDPALKPGESRTFSLDLVAGKYALVCNIEKHYGMGMRAPLTVTP